MFMNLKVWLCFVAFLALVLPFASSEEDESEQSKMQPDGMQHDMMQGQPDDMETMEMEGMDHGVMTHDSLEASNEMSLEIEVTKDIMSGYNVHVMPTGFVFTPKAASIDENVDGEGHAHIYLNGEKISRVYGRWFHLDNSLFAEGENEIKVSLNGNNHSPYTYEEEAVEATTTVNVSKHGSVEAVEAMSIKLNVSKDPMSGYNLHIKTAGFDFTPGRASLWHVDGKGYAQIFVNGTKIARAYTPWFHLDKSFLTEDENEISVSLLSNDHSYYTYDGEAIKDTSIVKCDP